MPASLLTAAGILGAVVSIWTGLVDRVVTKPYLDEFFHIPQAQLYCLGHFDRWDPKITTPPGLYLIAAGLKDVAGCDITVLRRDSAVCLFALFLALFALLRRHDRAHTALNIALFPPLFFFSGLYYTDVASSLSVVLFHLCFSSKALSRLPLLVQAVCLYLLGIVALFFRQTNIFWVAVYPAAITVIDAQDHGHNVVRKSMFTKANAFGDTWSNVIRTAWKHKVVYDPDAGSAQIEDYLKCVLTIMTGIVRLLTRPAELIHLILRMLPFLGLLASFVAFVLWNGSVVLGDKGNHVATLHLPQMLYIWPYILFFSWPTLLPHVLGIAVGIAAKIPKLRDHEIVKRHSEIAKTPGIRYLFIFSISAFAAIRYNTIIHPFTLADNRHYTFYVFRLLMRPSWMRYAVIPVYALSAWTCIQACSPQTDRKTPQRTEGASTSLVMIWVATSALCLITAPLVEPRYFILPWLFWTIQQPPTSNDRLSQRLLWLQTAWLLLINAVTGYMFLAKTFRWPSEPDALQRFMW